MTVTSLTFVDSWISCVDSWTSCVDSWTSFVDYWTVVVDSYCEIACEVDSWTVVGWLSACVWVGVYRWDAKLDSHTPALSPPLLVLPGLSSLLVLPGLTSLLVPPGLTSWLVPPGLTSLLVPPGLTSLPLPPSLSPLLLEGLSRSHIIKYCMCPEQVTH